MVTKHRCGLGRQYAALQHSPIAQGSGILQDSYLHWECMIRPTPLSRIYHIMIFCGNDLIPRAFVLSPNIGALAGDKEIPHLYNRKRAHLCLYHPSSREWSAHMSIANDFVPWIYLWLMFFEHWLATGEWHGGGIHPNTARVSEAPGRPEGRRKKNRPNRRRKSSVELAYQIYDRRYRALSKAA